MTDNVTRPLNRAWYLTDSLEKLMQELISRRKAPALLKHTSTKAPGTCGELVQGFIDGRDFLVNCPIDLYAHAHATFSTQAGLHLADADRFSKIRDAIALAEYEWGFNVSHSLRLESDIPRGKGMASSTADLTAALCAITLSCQRQISPRMFASLLTEIEPSDCVHFQGIAHVNHLTGDLIETLPMPQGLRVLVVDCGGEIDTIGFDRAKARGVYLQHKAQIAGALDLLTRGLQAQRNDWVAQAATQSAALSQLIHHKPQFDEMVRLAQDAGALGVNCAHSGSVLGLLYAASDTLEDVLRERVERAFGASVCILGDHQIIGGGCVEYGA